MNCKVSTPWGPPFPDGDKEQDLKEEGRRLPEGPPHPHTALLPFLDDPEIPPLLLSYQGFLIQKGKSTCPAYVSNLLIRNVNPSSFYTRRKPPPFLCESHLSFAKVQTCRAGTFQAQTHAHACMLVHAHGHATYIEFFCYFRPEIVLPYLQSKGPPLGPNCR